MRKIRTLILVLFAGLFLMSCGKENVENKVEAESEIVSTTGIQVSKDGSIIETIVEDFSSEYYEEESLKNMILSEVAEFNKNSETDISVEKFQVKGKEVTVIIKYPSAAVYTQFNKNEYNNKELFYGTIAEAYKDGYSLDVTLQNVKNEEESIKKDDLLGMGERYILISGEPIKVKTFGKILYIGDHVIPASKNEADMTYDENVESQEKYYLVFD